jgi:hypothetical protein
MAARLVDRGEADDNDTGDQIEGRVNGQQIVILCLFVRSPEPPRLR